MKTRGTKEERKAAQWDALRQIKAYLKQPWKLSHPFSYAAQAEAVQEAKHIHDLMCGIRNSDALDDDTRRAVAARYAQAVDAAWDPDLVSAYQAIREKKEWDVEPVIRFLEADPWFFRTGYAKEFLIRRLTPRELTATQEERLRGVVLNVIETRDRREFRSYQRLARRVDSPELRQRLWILSENDAWDIRRRARWMLEAVGALPVRSTFGHSAHREWFIQRGKEMANDQLSSILDAPRELGEHK